MGGGGGGGVKACVERNARLRSRDERNGQRMGGVYRPLGKGPLRFNVFAEQVAGKVERPPGFFWLFRGRVTVMFFLRGVNFNSRGSFSWGRKNKNNTKYSTLHAALGCLSWLSPPVSQLMALPVFPFIFSFFCCLFLSTIMYVLYVPTVHA